MGRHSKNHQSVHLIRIKNRDGSTKKEFFFENGKLLNFERPDHQEDEKRKKMRSATIVLPPDIIQAMVVKGAEFKEDEGSNRITDVDFSQLLEELHTDSFSLFDNNLDDLFDLS